MDTVEKMFGDLESNNLLKVEESKKKLADHFSQSKYLTFIMDYLMDLIIPI